MWSTSEYAALHTLRDSLGVCLYRGVRLADGHPVLIKALGASRRDRPVDLAHLRHAYDIGRQVDSPSVVRPLALVQDAQTPALILDDDGSDPLERRLQMPLGLEQFLELAIRLAEALTGAHAAGLTHKNLKPESVLIHPHTGEVKLINLGLASVGEQPAERTPLIEGSLPYMSPEQTGRTTQSVDSRTDLYSLGITLFQLRSGQLPFQAGDPLGWMHCHLATPPPKLSDVAPGTPPAVSAIVGRLLEKAPEDRYQSALGLRLDLQRCLDELTASGRVEPFPLGTQDLSDRFCVPQRLYGRAQEVGQLLAAFDRVVATGAPLLMLVSGYSGSGKSVLVRELYKPLVRERGYFLEGKCDQVQRGAPYSTVAQAFGGFIRELLTQDEVQIARWRSRFAAAVGLNAQLLINVVPELQLLLGEQAAVPPLPPSETENRFRLVFRRFLSVFTRREHPLALFLEDLQWADAATLDLVRDVLTHNDTPYLLLVGAYRSNEVGPTHPLSAMLKRLPQGGAAVEQLQVEPLHRTQVTELVADSVRRPRKQAEPLAQLIHDKTAGNPFFVVQLLTTLHQENFLELDRKTGSWGWSLEAIRARGYSREVVDLMVRRLRKLPGTTQDALKVAACLGNTFELSLLARFRHQTVEQLQADLWEAVRLGVLSRSDGLGRFVHDRLQQAALFLLPEEARAFVQLEIGRLLLSLTPDDQLHTRVFDVVNPLNHGASRMTDAQERLGLARLNLLAGRKAKNEAAYGAAVHYLARGVELLEPDAWEQHHALAFALHLERAQCEYLNKAFERAEAQLAWLLRGRLSLIERANVYEVGVQLRTTKGRVGEAVALGLECLRLYGIEVPLHPTREQVEEQCRRVLTALGERPIEKLADLPQMTDPSTQALTSVLARVLPAALFFDINTWSVLTCHSARTSIEKGNTDSSTVAYSSFATVLGVFFGNYRDGHRFGAASLALLEQRKLVAFRANVYLFTCLVNYWVEPLAEVLPYFERSFRAGVESGELAFACYSCTLLVTALLNSGTPLAEAQRVSEAKLDFVRRERFETVAAGIVSSQLLIQSLTGYGELDEAQHERSIQKLWSIEICLFYVRKLQARFFQGKPEEAVAAAERARPHLWSCQNLMHVVDYTFYRAMAQAQLGQHEGLAELSRQLWRWAENCRENFEDRAALVSAELARLRGDSFHAMRLYEHAVRVSREQGFVHIEAVAHEAAARFYEERGFHRFANLSLQQARERYLRWGAEAKVRALDGRHPELSRQLPAPAEATGVTFTARPSELDLLSVVKASQTISRETLLEELAPTLVRVVIEQGSAQRGCLLLARDGTLTLEAEAEFDEKGLRVELIPGMPLASVQRVPHSVIQRAVLTREQVILDDVAMAHSPYSDDEYLARRRPRSVLCMPVLRRAEAVGYLYLENTLSTEAFTRERLMVLELLASQAAISIDNARLLTRERRARGLAEQAERRAGVLAEASALLAESLEHEDVLAHLSELVVREVADWCQFDLMEGGVIRRHAGAHENPAKEPLLRELAARYPSRTDALHPSPAARVLATGRTLLLPEVDENTLATTCMDDRHAALIRGLGTRSALAVPLQVRGKTLGALTLGSATSGRYRPADVELVEELARRAAMALENSLLYGQAREAIRVRDDFLSIASHELRTPLTPLHLQLRALQRRLLSLVTEPGASMWVQTRMDLLLRQSRRMARLVNELLDISRISGRRLQLELSEVNLGEVVRDVVDTLREHEGMARLGSDVRVHARPGVVGRWDRLRVEQVVTNLVSNALKFGAGKPVDLWVEEADERAVLTVVDRGIGVPLDARERIFRQFERAVSGRHYGGLGLGLFIVKQIVEALDGRITVQSTPGSGATFTVALPIAGPSRGEPAVEEGPLPH